MRNIALGRGSTTRPSTSMAPSFLAILFGDPCFLRFRVFSCNAPVLGQPWLRLRNVGQWVDISEAREESARKPHRWSTIPALQPGSKIAVTCVQPGVAGT